MAWKSRSPAPPRRYRIPRDARDASAHTSMTKNIASAAVNTTDSQPRGSGASDDISARDGM